MFKKILKRSLNISAVKNTLKFETTKIVKIL